MQGPQQEVQGPPVNRKYVQGPQNMWPLHTSGALAPLFVVLAPISIYQICGPCTWPLHLFSWPLPMATQNSHENCKKLIISKLPSRSKTMGQISNDFDCSSKVGGKYFLVNQDCRSNNSSTSVKRTLSVMQSSEEFAWFFKMFFF